MIISYFGKQNLKVQYGDLVICVDPVSKKGDKNSGSKFGSDIVISTTPHPDYNGIEEAVYGDKEPFVIRSAGEYEIGGTEIVGAHTITNIDKKRYKNTCFRFVVEDINLGVLGPIDKESFTSKVREVLGGVDILFLPLSGGDGYGVDEAEKIYFQVEPPIVVPVDYSPEDLEKFVKKIGAPKETVDKLTIKKKDVYASKGDIIVIKKS